MATRTKSACVLALEWPWMAHGQLGWDPMGFGVAVLTRGRETFMRWVDRGLALRLMAADALGLTDHSRLVQGVIALRTAWSRDLSDQDASG